MDEKIHNCPELVEYVTEIGFLPLLDMGIGEWSAEQSVDEDCRYVVLPDGGWEWPLWKWKGSVVQESGCGYGKFFMGKAGFVSREWWPDFCNYRRSRSPEPEADSIETTILQTLRHNGSMITRVLRSACGFTGPKMRSRFDAYITRLEMQCRIVIEDFVYPRDRHNHEYGWGWALLTTPESLFGATECRAECSAEESYSRLINHFRRILPNESDKTLAKIIG